MHTVEYIAIPASLQTDIFHHLAAENGYNQVSYGNSNHWNYKSTDNEVDDVKRVESLCRLFLSHLYLYVCNDN